MVGNGGSVSGTLVFFQLVFLVCRSYVISKSYSSFLEELSYSEGMDTVYIFLL